MSNTKRVFVGVDPSGRVATLISDIGPEIADDVAEAIRAGEQIHVVALADAPNLGDVWP